MLVDGNDRVGNLAQIRAFLEAGFEGAFSFEATAPEILDAAEPEAGIKLSMDFLSAAVNRKH